MRRYLTNPVIVILLLVSASACKKTNDAVKILSGPEMISAMINGEQFTIPDNYVVVRHSAISSPMRNDNGEEVVFFADFKHNDQPVNVGNIVIGDRTIQPLDNSAYWFDYKTENVLQEGLHMLDTHVQITIPESQYSSGITDTMSMPGQLKFSCTNYYSSTLNKNQDFEVSWNKNIYSNTQQLVIQIYYLTGLSKHYNSSFPNSIESINYNVPNTGRFTIPSADFERFPAGTYVEAMIGTGSYKVLRPTRGPDIYFLTLSDEISPPLKVIE